MNKIPKGWELKKLGEIFNVIGGGTPNTNNAEFWSGNISWISSADIDKENFNAIPRKFITENAIQNSATNLVPKNTIIVVTRVGLGKVAITKEPMCFSQDSQALIPFEKINVKFMAYQIKQIAQNFINISRGTTINGITKQNLKDCKICVPPLSEQKAIADKLDDSFAKIENAITNLINAKENLKLYKQSVLKSAFNGDLLPSTSPTQRKKVKFEDVLKYEQPTKYIVKSTKYNNDFKTPVLTAGKGFILGYTNETEGIFTNTPVIIFDDFTTSSQYVNFHFKVKSSAMKILRPADNVNLKFLFYKMQTIQHKSDTHKRYWISEYAKLKIPLPPLSEQNLIVTEIDRRFAIVDKTLNLIDKSIQNAKNLKQSILKKHLVES